MMMLMFLLFMIPLGFYNKFWMMKNMIVFLTFIFLMKIPFLSYSNISYFMGYDFLSYFLILLSMWILFLMFMASEKLFSNQDYTELFILLVLFLLLFLVLTFMSMNIFMFYMFFESSLIPILILIMGWGYQPERIQAGMYSVFGNSTWTLKSDMLDVICSELLRVMHGPKIYGYEDIAIFQLFWNFLLRYRM